MVSNYLTKIKQELSKLPCKQMDEKEVLITKTVSWLLRALVAQDKDEVRRYLVKNISSLPRIAYRETLRKIETGKNRGIKVLLSNFWYLINKYLLIR